MNFKVEWSQEKGLACLACSQKSLYKIILEKEKSSFENVLADT